MGECQHKEWQVPLYVSKCSIDTLSCHSLPLSPLAEKDCLLSDATTEKKWVFKFVDVMTYSKGPKGSLNLFKEITFYMMPKVSVNIKLLKNHITAEGSQVQISMMPTMHILRGKVH